MKSMRNSKGMTLVELLAVIVLIGLIMAVVAKGIFSKSDAAKAKLNVVKMEKLKESIEQYRFEYNSYPSSLQDLIHPSGDVRDSGKVFVALAGADDLKDIWGFDYIYRAESDGRSFSLTSYGSDGVAGGDGPKQDVTLRP